MKQVLFTFSIWWPNRPLKKEMLYQAVKMSPTQYHMEKKGVAAKRFETFMWCGSAESLLEHYKALQYHYGTKNVTEIVQRPLP